MACPFMVPLTMYPLQACPTSVYKTAGHGSSRISSRKERQVNRTPAARQNLVTKPQAKTTPRMIERQRYDLDGSTEPKLQSGTLAAAKAFLVLGISDRALMGHQRKAITIGEYVIDTFNELMIEDTPDGPSKSSMISSRKCSLGDTVRAERTCLEGFEGYEAMTLRVPHLYETQARTQPLLLPESRSFQAVKVNVRSVHDDNVPLPISDAFMRHGSLHDTKKQVHSNKTSDGITHPRSMNTNIVSSGHISAPSQVYLSVEIPNSRLERYTVMFDGILRQSPKMLRRPVDSTTKGKHDDKDGLDGTHRLRQLSHERHTRLRPVRESSRASVHPRPRVNKGDETIMSQVSTVKEDRKSRSESPNEKSLSATAVFDARVKQDTTSSSHLHPFLEVKIARTMSVTRTSRLKFLHIVNSRTGALEDQDLQHNDHMVQLETNSSG